MKQILKSWVPLTAAFTFICGILYVTIQQTYRSNANDPQIQLAENTAALLNSGADPGVWGKAPAVEISTSLKPYLIIYDGEGNPIASDAVLDGKIPVLPAGVLDYTREQGSNIVTWQPRREVRSAIVILPFHSSISGFVVAGRSLRLVEEREGILIRQIAIGWIVSLILLLIVVGIAQVIFKS
ncbi:MAG: hypothetical protein ABIQ74_05500 [Chitinophagales bacterium]